MPHPCSAGSPDPASFGLWQARTTDYKEFSIAEMFTEALRQYKHMIAFFSVFVKKNEFGITPHAKGDAPISSASSANTRG